MKKQKKMKNIDKANGSSRTQEAKTQKDDDLKSAAVPGDKPKTKSLVDELKLFQNNQLLNQQDPLHQLHKQLNELIKDNNDKHAHQAFQNENFHHQPLQQSIANGLSQQTSMVATNDTFDCNANSFTIKKGVLWQQHIYEKFHQRLLNRWKKRYFILTTDYLVCFKRSSPKVGHSEMGRFLYKISLCDVNKVSWLHPKKHDKGSIVLNLVGPFNLLLWSKENCEEWMILINESMQRNKLRRSGHFDIRRLNHAKINSPLTCPSFQETNMIQEQSALISTISNSNEQYSNSDVMLQTRLSEREPSQVPSEKAQTSTGSSSKFKPREELGSSRGSLTDSTGKILSENGTSGSRHKQSSNLSSTRLFSNDIKSPRAPVIRSSMQVRNGELSIDSIERKNSPDSIKKVGEDGERSVEANDNGITAANHSSEKSPAPKMINGQTCIDRSLEVDAKGEELKQDNGTAGQQPRASNQRTDSSALESGQKAKTRRSGQSPANKQSNLEDRASDKDNLSLEKSTKGVSREQVPVERQSLLVEQQNRRRGTNDQTESHRSNQMSGKAAEDGTNDSGGNSQSTNLIRRDDSWQSLVSLTRIGCQPSASSAVQGQRSLYAQYLISGARHGDGSSLRATGSGAGNQPRQQPQSQQHHINIESTVTPLRAPLLRQQSLHSVRPNQRKLRQLPPIGDHPNAASFDTAKPMSRNQQLQSVQLANQFRQSQQQPISGSYQQKLMHLKLLHSNSNSEYARYGTQEPVYDSYSIYGPAESAANHYGYSSMRSNLKSATSEFSFIRTTASQASQPTVAQLQEQRQLLAGANLAVSSDDQTRGELLCRSLSPNSNLGQGPRQYLINPLSGELLVDQQALVRASSPLAPEMAAAGGASGHPMAMVAPLRELPVKPGKRRAGPYDGELAGTSRSGGSTLGSSIAGFFRRAFSFRSKKNRRASKRGASKMAESCSSSLGAFDDNLGPHALLPSAFSTGSKSVVAADARRSSLQRQAKIADMIETFASKTQLGLMDQSEAYQTPLDAVTNSDSQAIRAAACPTRPHSTTSQFSSPLHKSNSVSATMGLSGSLEANLNPNRRSYFETGADLLQHQQQQQHQILNGQLMQAGRSPLMSRSAKVMSANLTPLLSRKELQLDSHSNQIFMSPRSAAHRPSDQPLPRPSSIYGQPSMISTPVISLEDRRTNFGLHRASLQGRTSSGEQVQQLQHLHSQQQRNAPSGGVRLASGLHAFMKMPHELDTTREVAEDVPSPVLESSGGFEALLEPDRLDNGAHLGSNYERQLRKTRAVAMVRPSATSANMETIYDNHPALLADRNEEPYEPQATESLYDNHISPGQQLQQQQQLLLSDQMASPSQMARRSTRLASSRTTHFGGSNNSSGASAAPFMTGSQMTPEHQLVRTPSHQMSAGLATTNEMHSTPVASHRYSVLTGSKPLEVVTPSARGAQSAVPATRSPIAARRSVAGSGQQYQQGHFIHQQSPLVSQRTRVVTRSDGTQATIIGNSSRLREPDEYQHGPAMSYQPVVNIASAPGISLDPALAASLLRGTNIDAYQTNTLLSDPSGGSGHNSDLGTSADYRTFLVSTKLSKSMANDAQNGRKMSASSDSQSSSSPTSNNQSDLTNERKTNGATSKATYSSREELSSSSSSKSRKSSSSAGGPRRDNTSKSPRTANSSTGNNASESSQNSTFNTGRKSSKPQTDSNNNLSANKLKSIHRKNSSRDSSSEPSEDVTSRGSLDKLESERNWITSKLVEE